MKYFVSYAVNYNQSQMFGSTFIETSVKIKSENHINDVRETIRSKVKENITKNFGVINPEVFVIILFFNEIY